LLLPTDWMNPYPAAPYMMMMMMMMMVMMMMHQCGKQVPIESLSWLNIV